MLLPLLCCFFAPALSKVRVNPKTHTFEEHVDDGGSGSTRELFFHGIN